MCVRAGSWEEERDGIGDAGGAWSRSLGSVCGGVTRVDQKKLGTEMYFFEKLYAIDARQLLVDGFALLLSSTFYDLFLVILAPI